MKMARAKLNPTIEELRGAIGEIVFKRVRGKIIATKKPVFSKEQKPSAKQLANRQRFREAAAYAKVAQKDPVLRPIYEPVARQRQVAVYTVALRDHRNAPKIKHIYLWGYQGQPGEQIAIQAKDDFGLAELQVRLTTPDGTVVEGGQALEDKPHSGFWLYTTTVAAVAGSTLRVEVEGADYAGNRVRAVEEIVVGVSQCVDVKVSERIERHRAAPAPLQESEALAADPAAEPDELAVSTPEAAGLAEAPCIADISEPVEAAAIIGPCEENVEDEQPGAAETPAGEPEPAELMPLAQAPVPAETLPVPLIWWALLAAVRLRHAGAGTVVEKIALCQLPVAGGAQGRPGVVNDARPLTKRALAPPV
jgi:hypothetical protein